MSAATTIQPPLTPPRRGNPLAPEWMLPSFELPFCESEFVYSKVFTILAGAELTDQVIAVSADAPFMIRSIEFWQQTAGADDTGLQVRFRDGQGKRMSREYCNYLDVAGALTPVQPMAAGSQFGLDFLSSSASTIIVQVTLRGVKRGPPVTVDPRLAALDQEYMPLWRRYSAPMPNEYDRAFDYYFEIETAASAIISTALLMDDDADFYWRSFTGAVVGAGCQVTLQFNDQVGNTLSVGQVTDVNYFDTQQGKPLYPELYCPYGCFLALRGREVGGAGGVVQLNLKGVKRYQR